jgi:hypothetical protein
MLSQQKAASRIGAKSHRMGTKNTPANQPAGGQNPPAAQAGQNNPPAAPPAGGDGKSGGQNPPAPPEFTIEQIQQMIGKSVTDALKSELPKHQQGHVTEDGVKAIIEAQFKLLKGDSTTMQTSEIKSLVENTCKAQMDAMRKSKQFTNDPGDQNQPAGGQDRKGLDIEMPVSWSKGNLPLHGKQLLNILMNKNPNDGVGQSDVDRGIKLGEKTIQSYRNTARLLEKGQAKALTSTGAATGDEFVPSDLSSELQRRLYLESKLASIMMAREFDMPSQPYTFPLSTTRPSFYLETAENNDATGSTPGTGNLILDAKKFMGMVEASYEMDEDSIIPVLPFIQQQLAEAAADAWEHALINGDDTATHQDTDEELLTQSPAFAFKGFRKLALAISALKSDISTGGISEANLRAIRVLMKKYGMDPRKLIWLACPTAALTMQGIANVATMEKFGPKATILTGELDTLFNIPIVPSERMRDDLGAAGVNAASGNTYSSVILVRPDRFFTGRRREFTGEVDRNIKSQTHQIVASFRKAITPIETPSATVTSVAIGYKITL